METLNRIPYSQNIFNLGDQTVRIRSQRALHRATRPRRTSEIWKVEKLVKRLEQARDIGDMLKCKLIFEQLAEVRSEDELNVLASLQRARMLVQMFHRRNI